MTKENNKNRALYRPVSTKYITITKTTTSHLFIQWVFTFPGQSCLSTFRNLKNPFSLSKIPIMMNSQPDSCPCENPEGAVSEAYTLSEGTRTSTGLFRTTWRGQ